MHLLEDTLEKKKETPFLQFRTCPPHGLHLKGINLKF